MSSEFPIDPSMSMKQAQDMELVRRKMDIDAMRKHLTPAPDQKAKLREACQGFETMFIQKLWEQMRNNVPKEGYLHSKQEGMYQSMYDHEFSKKMAEAGGIGLGDMLYEQLSQSLGESARSKLPGASSRLPLIPASSSPTAMKYSGALQEAVQIKPLYEDAADLDEMAPVELEQFAIHGARNSSGIAVPRSNPWEQAVNDLHGRQDADADEAVLASGQALTAAQLNGVLAAVAPDAQNAAQYAPGLDFESLSQEMLQDEIRQSASGVTEAARETPAPTPISVYAQAFNRRHAAGILAPEQSQALAEALKENSRANMAAQFAGNEEHSESGRPEVSARSADLSEQKNG